MIISLKKRIFIFLITSLFLSGCDYKLRDSYRGLNDLALSITFENNNINQGFITELQKQTSSNKIYLNESDQKADLHIKILDHEIIRYSSALGIGARTREARMEYHLKINLNFKGSKENLVLEFKDNNYYSFDESRILAIEEVEEGIRENFFRNSIKRINFSLLKILNEDN